MVDIEAVLDQVPALAGSPRTVEELSGGLTNQNLKVVTPTGEYVVRLARSDSSLLGIDRDAESYNTKAAEASGAGAPFIDYRPDLGALVIGYVGGHSYVNEDLRAPGVLPRLAAVMRMLHGGPRFSTDFDMFVRQPTYLRTCVTRGFHDAGRLRLVRRRLPPHPGRSCLPPAADRAVQQRPARRQHRRRRRAALADRLRLRRQQRRLLRARQLVDRVRARRRPPGRAGHRVRRPRGPGADRPRPAPGDGVALRLVAVGLHPGRDERRRLRLLRLGPGALRQGRRGLRQPAVRLLARGGERHDSRAGRASSSSAAGSSARASPIT